MCLWYGWRRWWGCGRPARWAGWAWSVTACSAASASTVAETGLLDWRRRLFGFFRFAGRQANLLGGTGFAGQAGVLDAPADPQAQPQHQQCAQYPQLIFLDAAQHAFQYRAEMVSRSPQRRGPHGGADPVQQQVAARRVARQTNGHRH